MSNYVLDIDGVVKTFGGLHALADINLKVEQGTTHAIIGPNGAGKSTLLNCCIGRLTPDSGTVTFGGVSMVGMQPYEINHAGMVRVFQTPEIFPDLTVKQNVLIPALAKRDGTFSVNPFRRLAEDREVQQMAEEALHDMELEIHTNKPAGSMSRGDKRRLELAMGLVQKPKLLLLDEPTAGMARADTNRTIDILKKIKKGGMTKVVIEHDMHVVFSLADKISVLAQGRIIAEGTPEEIKGSAKVQEAYLGGAEE